MSAAIGQAFEWMLIFCAVYFIVDWMVGRWGPK